MATTSAAMHPASAKAASCIGEGPAAPSPSTTIALGPEVAPNRRRSDQTSSALSGGFGSGISNHNAQVTRHKTATSHRNAETERRISEVPRWRDEEPSSAHEAAVQPTARPCPASFELTRSARHALLNG